MSGSRAVGARAASPAAHALSSASIRSGNDFLNVAAILPASASFPIIRIIIPLRS